MKTAKVKATNEVIEVYATELVYGDVCWHENASLRTFKESELEFITKH